MNRRRRPQRPPGVGRAGAKRRGRPRALFARFDLAAAPRARRRDEAPNALARGRHRDGSNNPAEAAGREIALAEIVAAEPEETPEGYRYPDADMRRERERARRAIPSKTPGP